MIDTSSPLDYADFLDEHGREVDAMLIRLGAGKIRDDGSVEHLAKPAISCLVTTEPNHGRRRVRRLDVSAIVGDAVERAITSREWVAVAEHGGSVANAYKYPADTEAVLVVVDPRGRAAVWFHVIAAKGTTRASAAGVVHAGWLLFAGTTKEAAKLEAMETLKQWHAYAMLIGKGWSGSTDSDTVSES